jgi:hypothetical protein
MMEVSGSEIRDVVGKDCFVRNEWSWALDEGREGGFRMRCGLVQWGRRRDEGSEDEKKFGGRAALGLRPFTIESRNTIWDLVGTLVVWRARGTDFGRLG